jgi:hypothetical protein
MRRFVIAVLLIAAVILWGCGGTKGAQGPPDNPVEKCLWKSQETQPRWVYDTPKAEGNIEYFVGISDDQANQQLARESARADAGKQVVEYMGNLVKSKYERVQISFGLASDVEDPTTSKKTFDEQLAANIVQQLRMRQWYEERWQKTTGISCKAFVLAEIPQANISDAYKSTAANMANQAAKKAKEQNDDQARAQYQKASEFWKQMEEQGLFKD